MHPGVERVRAPATATAQAALQTLRLIEAHNPSECKPIVSVGLSVNCVHTVYMKMWLANVPKRLYVRISFSLLPSCDSLRIEKKTDEFAV